MSWVYRKKLSELDNIQRYFSRKLSTPTFPPMAEEKGVAQPEEPIDMEGGSSQLLLKSNQLLGEVSSIISGECLPEKLSFNSSDKNLSRIVIGLMFHYFWGFSVRKNVALQQL